MTEQPRDWPEGGQPSEMWHDCADCGDTIYIGEHIYEVGDGRVRCAVCVVKARNAESQPSPATR